MIASLLTFLFLTPADAHATRFEVSLTSHFQNVRDPRWATVSSTSFHSASGLTAGMEVSPGTSIIVGFNTGREGSRILVPTIDGVKEQGFNLATTITHYQLGARYRWNWKKRLVPTTTLSMQIGHASLRMDENIDNDGEEVETRHEAMAMGFEIGGGLEYTVAYMSNEDVRFNIGFEAGYTNLMKLRYKATENGPVETSLGEINLGGPFLTLSAGTRF